MNLRTFVRPEAQTDVRDAALWYESREAGLGLRFIAEVRTSLQHIKTNPLRFPSVDESVRRALLNSFPCSIYFLNEGNVITGSGDTSPTSPPGFLEKPPKVSDSYVSTTEMQ